MPQKLILLLVLISFFSHAQNTLKSPFSIDDYQAMRKDYLKAVEGNPEVIHENNAYYVKKKFDSVTAIRHDIIRKELIKEGAFPSSITEETIQFRERDKNLYLQYAYFTIKRKGYQFYYSDYPKLVISTDNNLTIYFLPERNPYAEGIQGEKNYTQNEYFNLNHQLKRTDTYKAGTQELTGISKEYNIIGKLLFEVDWDKDFKHTKEQAIKAGEKFALHYLKDEIKKKPREINKTEAREILGNFLRHSQQSAQKIKTEDRIPAWVVSYWVTAYRLEITIADKTFQHIKTKHIPMQE